MDSNEMAMPYEQTAVREAQTDPAAFAALYEHYFKRVYNYMRYRLDDPATADDLTSQVFQRALTALPSYNAQRAPFGAWLFGIAHHVVTDHFRRRKRRRWLSLDILGQRPAFDPLPEEAAAQSEKETAVLNAITGLDEREREIIALKFAAGLNNRQIADQLGLTASNVGVILYRAMQKARAAIADKETTP
jgi:RNA polymerase sigma-70 factor, ECF subfamily